MLTGIFPDDLQEQVQTASKRSLLASADVLQRSFIRGLSQNPDVPVTVINSMHIGSYPRSSRMAFVPKYQSHSILYNVRIHNIGFINLPILSTVSRWHSMRRAYFRTVGHPSPSHSVLIYSMLDWNMLFIATLPRGSRAPRVCLVVTDLPQHMVFYGAGRQSIRRLYHRVRSALMRAVSQRALRRVDAFVLLAPDMHDALDCGRRPVLELEGVVDTHFFDKVRETSHECSEVSRVVAYTGGLEAELGVGDLLIAFESLSSSKARLVIAGDGQLRSAVLKAAAANPRITYEGTVTHDRAAQIQLEADVLVCPTRVDGQVSKYAFPAKLLEYLYSGNVVVSRRLEAIPTYYDSYILYAEGAGTAQLTAAIASGLKASHRRTALERDSQRAAVRDRSSVEASGRAILDLLIGERQ